MEDGVMKMRPVEAIEVAPGEPTVLGPGGLHIMMMGLKAPLVEGERFPVTLVFERAGEATVHVVVDKATSMHGPSQQRSDHTTTN
jgi:copper(I)-binding protein